MRKVSLTRAEDSDSCLTMILGQLWMKRQDVSAALSPLPVITMVIENTFKNCLILLYIFFIFLAYQNSFKSVLII